MGPRATLGGCKNTPQTAKRRLLGEFSPSKVPKDAGTPSRGAVFRGK